MSSSARSREDQQQPATGGDSGEREPSPDPPSWLDARRNWAHADTRLARRWRLVLGWALLLLLIFILGRMLIGG